MRRSPAPSRRGLGILLLVLLLAGCSGSGNAGGVGTATPVPTPTTQQILSRASQRIAQTTSLRFTLDVQGETYVDTARTIRLINASGELVRPDRVHAQFKVKVLGSVTVSMQIITIGDKTWSTDLITGKWQPAPMEFTYSPAVLFDTKGGVGPVMDSITDPRQLPDETMHDRRAYRIHAEVDKAVIGPLTSETMTRGPVAVDLWIAQDNYDLLRAVLTEPPAPGGEQAIWTLDLYDHDKGFTIAPPNGG